MTTNCDVVIIGAGPAGLSAALYTGRARLSTIVLEKSIPGGQILVTDWIENYPGFPDGIAPFDLMDKFRAQAEAFGAKIVTDDAQTIVRDGDGWIVKGGGADYRARAVIVATGAAYRRLGLPNEARLVGRGVSYCATCDGPFFRDSEIAVVGGGDQALMEAIFLTKFAKTVHLIHRRDAFRGTKILQERVAANAKIAVHWSSVIVELRGEDKLEALLLKNTQNGTEHALEVEGLFVSIGMDPLNEMVKGLVDLSEWGEIVVKPNMATSQPGIFAAGDIIDFTPHQVATAVGTGVHAAISADEYLSRK
jgi:thioredoxin reductase (NADPH)